MSLSRRGFLGAMGLTAIGAAGVGAVVFPSGETAELLRSRASLPEPFRVPLPIPAMLEGDCEIIQRVADLEILPGLRTSMLTYGGTFPGPTIVSRRGTRTVVTHRNELPVPTAVHLHGGHVPADQDGYPTDMLLPAGWDHHSAHGGAVTRVTREYVYPCDQRAATLWYHDHRMDFAGPQVYRGLAGFHLITDDEEDALPLPKGDRDLPLMITDRAFDADGSLRYPSLDSTLRQVPGVDPDFAEGVLGDVVLVNGAPWPVHEVDAVRHRLRLLNASNARRYRLEFDPPTSLVQIGSDGGLLDRPRPLDDVVMAPGERFDVVVDFAAHSPGTEVTVRNGLDGGPVMRFRVRGKASDDTRVPETLSRYERLDPAATVRTRVWRFSRKSGTKSHSWRINGEPFDPDRVDAAVPLGELEIWRFVSDLHHPVHVHLDPFQVVARRGHAPGPYDGGWKDTVDIGPADYVDVAVRFTGHKGQYLVHCHNLEHEDMAMMARFDTT